MTREAQNDARSANDAKQITHAVQNDKKNEHAPPKYPRYYSAD